MYQLETAKGYSLDFVETLAVEHSDSRLNLVPDAGDSGYSALCQPQRMPGPSTMAKPPLLFGNAHSRLQDWIGFLLNKAETTMLLHLGGPPRLGPG